MLEMYAADGFFWPSVGDWGTVKLMNRIALEAARRRDWEMVSAIHWDMGQYLDSTIRRS